MRMLENPRRTRIPQHLRKKILNGLDSCPECGRSRELLIQEAIDSNYPVGRCNRGLTIDHRIPRSKGGTNELSNLQAMCYPCNQLKKDT